MKISTLYVYLLVTGWTSYAVFYFYVNSVGYIDSLKNAAMYCLLIAAGGIIVSLLYRRTAIRLGWLNLPAKALIVRVSFSVICMGAIMTTLNFTVEKYTFPQFTQDVNAILLTRYLGSWLQVFFIYVFIYHLFVYYEKSSMAEKARINAELYTLRSQINPHFYFNTLNNLYGLALENSPRTQEAILKLSSIMEYIIYDCRSLEVPLTREIRFIESYIELERLRYDEAGLVQFSNAVNTTDLQIAPMLLIPFVENAFKHGVQITGENTPIIIKAYLEKKKFYFEVKNSSNNEVNKGKVGIENVQKRLSLLYPNKHLLSVKIADDQFQVNLSISL